MKIQRLIALLTVLLRTDSISASKLATKFGVSVRTIFRDVRTLEDAGIPIVTTPGVHGGIGILPQYKIDKALFTHGDISALLLGLESMSESMPSPALSRTLEKVRSLIPKEQAPAFEMDARKLQIDLTPWAGNTSLRPNLDMLRKALEENRLVRFDYTSNKQIKSQRTVEPHQLVLKESQWYLHGYCYTRESFRVFKLRRISRLELLDERFEPRDFPPTLSEFRAWKHEQMLEIELVIDPSIKEQLLDRCNEEDITQLDDGRFHVRLNFVESEMGYGYLMQFGNKCQCIAPPRVRDALIRRIGDSLLAYAQQK